MSLADLATEELVARALGASVEQLHGYATHAKQASFYNKIQIPKRGRHRRGQFRVVYEALYEWLQDVHKNIARLVNQNAAVPEWPECVQGFVADRSIRSNAKHHLGARLLLLGDLANFFDTITVGSVRTAFEELGAAPAIAELLARVSTIDGALRQGTRCSPAIANAVCRHLDQDLLALANPLGAHYTRYGDDLTFSGDRVPASARVDAIVRQHGFALRDGRCLQHRRGRRQYVTGLTISDPNGPRVPRRLKRQLRLVMHYVEKFGIDAHTERVLAPASKARRGTRTQTSLEGMLRFVQSIERPLAAKLRAQLATGIALSERLREADEAESRDDDDEDDEDDEAPDTSEV